MQNDLLHESRRARVHAAQLAHGIKYQGAFYVLSITAWVVFIVLLKNGVLF